MIVVGHGEKAEVENRQEQTNTGEANVNEQGEEQSLSDNSKNSQVQKLNNIKQYDGKPSPNNYDVPQNWSSKSDSENRKLSVSEQQSEHIPSTSNND